MIDDNLFKDSASDLDLVLLDKLRNESGHCIVIEGCDGTGKTTYAEYLKAKYPHMNYEIVHFTRSSENNIDMFCNYLLSGKNYIFDRFCFGQFVYQTKEERENRGWLNFRDLSHIVGLMNGLNTEVIYMTAPIETIYNICRNDNLDKYYTQEYVTTINAKFEEIINAVEIKNTHTITNFYNPTSDESQPPKHQFDNKSFDYSSLPKVVAVDFDGTLAIGDKPFPEIGYLNENLVHDLFQGKYKDYKKILYTHRTGDTLIEACNWLADHGIVFDAINENIQEVKDACNGGPQHKPWFDVIIDDKAVNSKVYENRKASHTLRLSTEEDTQT